MNQSTGVCEGCLRTLDEIAAWGRLDDDGKRALWVQLERRRAARRQPDGAGAVGDGGPA